MLRILLRQTTCAMSIRYSRKHLQSIRKITCSRIVFSSQQTARSLKVTSVAFPLDYGFYDPFGVLARLSLGNTLLKKQT